MAPPAARRTSAVKVGDRTTSTGPTLAAVMTATDVELVVAGIRLDDSFYDDDNGHDEILPDDDAAYLEWELSHCVAAGRCGTRALRNQVQVARARIETDWLSRTYTGDLSYSEAAIQSDKAVVQLVANTLRALT